MKDEEKDWPLYEEEPAFDEEFKVISIPCHVVQYSESKKTESVVFMIDETGYPCRRKYVNGKLVDSVRFGNGEQIVKWIECEVNLAKKFIEWYTKNAYRIKKADDPILYSFTIDPNGKKS